MAFVADWDGYAEVYVIHADGTGLVGITDNTTVDTAPKWSPDGQRLAFIHDPGRRPTLMVFNKIDMLEERGLLHVVAEQHPKCIFISAARGINISGLKQEVLKLLESEFVEEQLKVSQAHQKLISYLHSVGEVLDIAYEDNSVLLKLRMPKKDRERVMQMVSSQRELLSKEST